MQSSTSFYIPRVCKRWMPHDIMTTINNLPVHVLSGAKVIRVDIVPIVRNGPESFLDRLDMEHHSVFLYFDKPVNYSKWSNGIKGGKQTRIYTGVVLTATDGSGKTLNEYWVLIPNRDSGIIPFTNKTTSMLEHELNAIKELLPDNEKEIWEYDWNCVQFHKQLIADAHLDVCQDAFDKIYCAWVSIHQVASNVERLCARVR